MSEIGNDPGSPAQLAARAPKAPPSGQFCAATWIISILRLSRADSVEEHIHLSVLFKEFFAGELAVLCTLPDFWRKVSILYRGGDDFALHGAWDAGPARARVQRLFERFVEQNLQSFPGLAGRTISMALAIAPSIDVCSGYFEAQDAVAQPKRARSGRSSFLAVRLNGSGSTMRKN